MSEQPTEPFLGFDDITPCPKNYWKFEKQLQLNSTSVSSSSSSHYQSRSRKKRFVNCGKCGPCKSLPCGDCPPCHDKIYNGNKRKRKCEKRKCVLKSPKNKQVEIEEDELPTSSSDDEGEYQDDVLDEMLNKLLNEGAHKEALFKDLLVYKYWKLRPKPSPEELVSLANLLNMTMEGIQQILTNSKSDLLTILPRATQNSEIPVDSQTARNKIIEILKRYPKQTKALKSEINQSQEDQTPLSEDLAVLKKLVDGEIMGYTKHTSGLLVSVPIWIEGLYLFLTKSDLSSLAESRGLRAPKIKKMTEILKSGDLPEALVECLVGYNLNCPKYMNLSFSTLTCWAQCKDEKKWKRGKVDVQIKEEQLEVVDTRNTANKELPTIKEENKETIDEKKEEVVDVDECKEETEEKPVAEETGRKPKRYAGTVGKRGKKSAANDTKKSAPIELTFNKLDGGLLNILWRDISMDQVWTEGFFIPTTEYGEGCNELCYLCGSAGLAGFIYCSACAEPFHKYCLDMEDHEIISADWRCDRCIMCQICNTNTDQMLLKCCECYHTYHGGCLPSNVCTTPSKNGIWKCYTCMYCRKCGTKGDRETKWLYDFSVCKPCGKLYSKGNYCPLCEAVYEDEDYDTPMVSCTSCEHWVHIECDKISELEYEAMSNMPEDRVVYVCRRCSRDNVWRGDMIKCVQENLARCLKAVSDVFDSTEIRVSKYNTVKSIRAFESDVFQHIAETPGAVGTFRTVVNECFPWYSSVKKSLFEAQTPVKTPKKIHFFNKVQRNNNKIAQSFKSSTFLKTDNRKCVLCSQTGDQKEGSCGRLLMSGLDNWVHVNCALWSSEVYEESDGKLMNVEIAVNRGASLRCDYCKIYNATVGCCDKSCPRSFHFSCGVKSGAVFLSDKRLFCAVHQTQHRQPHWEHMEQREFSINRRIYIDPLKMGGSKRNTRPVHSRSLRPYVGSCRIVKLGDVMNISDHPETLVPIGFTLERLFWSFRDPAYRCKYRCTVVKQIPVDPDIYFGDLSQNLLSLNQPFKDWFERDAGTVTPDGTRVFEVTLTVQKPQLNSFNSDSFSDRKNLMSQLANSKTPIKVKAKIRQAREEPIMNLDGVKVRKSKVRKIKDELKRNEDSSRHRIKRVHKKKDFKPVLLTMKNEIIKKRSLDSHVSKAREVAREAALQLQKKRIERDEKMRVRRYARLDHTYGLPFKTMERSSEPLEYEKHITPLPVRPGYYIDCISANAGIKSLLQRVGGDDSVRCCGIPYLDPKVVFMYDDANGKRCIKMAPPVRFRRPSDDEFDSELPPKDRKMKSAHSVMYKYNRKKKKPHVSHARKSSHLQQGSSMYHNNQFKSRIVQQIRAYDPKGIVTATPRARPTPPPQTPPSPQTPPRPVAALSGDSLTIRSPGGTIAKQFKVTAKEGGIAVISSRSSPNKHTYIQITGPAESKKRKSDEIRIVSPDKGAVRDTVEDKPGISVTNSALSKFSKSSSSSSSSSNKVICVGAKSPSLTTVYRSPTMTSCSFTDPQSPARKKPKSEFDVFDFELFDEKSEIENLRCSMAHTHRIKKKNIPGSSLKLSTSTKPSWVCEEDKAKKKTDIENWLAQRQEKMKKATQETISFDQQETIKDPRITFQYNLPVAGISQPSTRYFLENASSNLPRQFPPRNSFPQFMKNKECSIEKFHPVLEKHKVDKPIYIDDVIKVDKPIDDVIKIPDDEGPEPPKVIKLEEEEEEEKMSVRKPMALSPTLLPGNLAFVVDKPNISKSFPRVSTTQHSVELPQQAQHQRISPSTDIKQFDFKSVAAGARRRVKHVEHKKQDSSEERKQPHRSTSIEQLRPKSLTNIPAKSPSPVKELLKEFINQREIKRTLNFDVDPWKKKKAAKPRPGRPRSVLDTTQNQKLMDCFKGYSSPKYTPISFTESLKSAEISPCFSNNLQPTNPSSRLTEINREPDSDVTARGDDVTAGGNDVTITVLDSGYLPSPGKISLKETASMLSSSMEICQNYPETSNTQSRDIGNASCDLGNESRDLGNASRDLGNESRGLGNESRDLGNESRDLGNESRDLGNTSRDLGNESRDLGNASRDLGNESRDLGNASRDLITPKLIGAPEVKTEPTCAPSVNPTAPLSPDLKTKNPKTPPPSLPITPCHVINLPDRNICSRHTLQDFMVFNNRIQPPPPPKICHVKREPRGASPSESRTKRKSAILASQNLVEKVYKDEDFGYSPKYKSKRKCERPTIIQSPAKTYSMRISPNKPTKIPLKLNSTVKLKLKITQTKDRTYIRCHSTERDPKELCFPVFVVTTEDGVYIETDDVDDAWTIVSTLIQRIRKAKQQSAIHGLGMWTLAHDTVVHVVEQLPNTHRLEEYSFHFPEHGPTRPHMNKVPPVPPGGAARTIPVVRRPYIDQFAFLNHPDRNVKPPAVDDTSLAVAMVDRMSHYIRRTTSLGDLPMAMRYRHIMRTVKEVLCVCPSGIHGRGLYCKQDISMGEMIIEYSGTLIRPGLCDIREKYYDSKGIGSYMFRIDQHEVVDATMSGSMARFINHSCDPNCYSRIINVDGKKKIIIFAERNIVKGEEVTYDYKFPSEDIKIPCLCGSEKCRKWMN